MASEPFRFEPVNVYDRSRLVLENAARGDLSGSLLSAIDPERLSPRQRESEWLPKGDDPVSTAIRSLANPLVAVGVVLAMRYPVPTAQQMFKFSKQVAGYSARTVPVLWRFQTPRSIFRGTRF